MNREIEVNHAHINYMHEYMPRRNRLTHSMLFEEFEMVLEDWEKLSGRFETDGKIRLKLGERMREESGL